MVRSLATQTAFILHAIALTIALALAFRSSTHRSLILQGEYRPIPTSVLARQFYRPQSDAAEALSCMWRGGCQR